MKIIDLLNKIVNGEELPKKIKYEKHIYEYEEETYDWSYYIENNGTIKFLLTDVFNSNDNILNILNNEVEILEEEKKIPEKIDVINWDKCIHDVTHKEKELAIEINKTQELLNQVIDYLDYLKSKGE